MARETDGALTVISFDQPAPSATTYSWDRDRHLRVIHKYVIDGEPLEAGELDDMLKNPEALSSQMEALEGWVNAVAAGEEGVWAEPRAAARLKFMEIVLGWSVELGYGEHDFHPNRTAGNGSSGVPECLRANIGSRREQAPY